MDECPMEWTHGAPFRYCPTCGWREEPEPTELDRLRAEVERLERENAELRTGRSTWKDRGRGGCLAEPWDGRS